MTQKRKLSFSGVTNRALDDWGLPPMPLHMGGEIQYDADLYASIVAHETTFSIGRKVEDPETGEEVEQTYVEPPIIVPSKSYNTTSIQTRRSGSNITVNDDAKYIQILHESGAAVQIDSNGNILIKSPTDGHFSGDNQFIRAESDFNVSAGKGMSILVESGTGRISIAGDLDIECENFNVTARGRTTINSGQGVEIQGARVGITARDDNASIGGKTVSVGAETALSLGSGGTVDVKGGQVFVDSDDVQLANGGSGNYGNPQRQDLEAPPPSRIANGSGKDRVNSRAPQNPVGLSPIDLDDPNSVGTR